MGQPMKKVVFEDGEELNFDIIPSDGRHQYSAPQVQELLLEWKPDIFFTLFDTFFTFAGGNNWFLPLQIPCKSVWYYPSDGGNFPLGCEVVLKKVTHPVAMAKFGQHQLRYKYGINSGYIPHGVDSTLYAPYTFEEKLMLRDKWSKKTSINLCDKFIIGCVGRNQGRKTMDRIFRAFAKFSKGKDDVILFMHSDPFDAAGVNNLLALTQDLGINHKVVWSGMKWTKGFPLAEMPDVYNLMDIFALPTTGEGFGIPIIEAMACEIPVICTDYTTTKELVTDNNAGLGIKLVGENHECYPCENVDNQILGNWNVYRGFCDINDFSDKMQFFYDDWKTGSKKIKEMGKNGREAVLRDYDWEIVMQQWLDLFEVMLE